MKLQANILGAAFLLCLSGAAIGAAHAQDMPSPPPNAQQGPPGGGRGGRGGMMDPARRAEMMQKQLGLTDDQTTQVKAILTDEMTKGQALRSDDSIPQEDKRAKMMAMRQDTETRINAILTADQKTKYAAMQEQMRQRQQNGGGAPPPPQL